MRILGIDPGSRGHRIRCHRHRRHAPCPRHDRGRANRQSGLVPGQARYHLPGHHGCHRREQTGSNGRRGSILRDECEERFEARTCQRSRAPRRRTEGPSGLRIRSTRGQTGRGRLRSRGQEASAKDDRRFAGLETGPRAATMPRMRSRPLFATPHQLRFAAKVDASS